MKLNFKSASPLRAAILLGLSFILLFKHAAQAVDYNYGAVTGNFTLTATDHARRLGAGTAAGLALGDNGWGGVYDRGAARDATYMHFNLSSLAGATINGTVDLNLTIDAAYGGAITGGVVGSATNAWSFPGNTGGITTISGANPSGTYTTGQIATAVIDNSTFQGFATNPSTFNGLGITAGGGSTAHFSGPATLTGNATTGVIAVADGTDWSAAAWNSGTSTLAISGASNVSGGTVMVRSGGTLSVTDSATLGMGSFAGTFANTGTLAFGSSSNQALSGVISGSGALQKSGAGTMTLSAANTYSGGTTVSAGILKAGNNSAFGNNSAAIVVNSGASLDINGTQLDAYTQNIQIAGPGADSSLGALGNSGGGSLNAVRGITLSGNTSIGGNNGRWDIGRLDYNGNANNPASRIDGGGFVLTKVGSGRVGILSGATNLAGFVLNGGMITPHVNTSLGSGPITINAGVFDTYSGLTLTNNFTLNGGTIQQVENFNDNYTGAFTVNAAATLHATNSGSITISGAVSGAGALSKTGSGILKLSGNNTQTGALTINGGNVRFASTVGNATNGNVELINPVSFLIMERPNQFGPNAGLRFNSSGSHNEFALYGNDQTIASLSSTNQFAVVQNSHASFGAATASSTLTVNQSTNTTYSGIIRDNHFTDAFTLSLIKSGTGTLAINGNNNYSGTTTINGGVIEVQTNNALGSTAGGTTVASGAALRLNNVNYSSAEPLSINGTGVSGGGALVNVGTSTFAGPITAATNATINAGGGTLTTTGGIVKNGTILTIAGGGSVIVNTTGISGSAANSDLVVDATTLVVNAASNYNGPTTVQNAGTLVANAAVTTTRMTVSANSTLSGTSSITTAGGADYVYLNGTLQVGNSTLGSPVASVLEFKSSGASGSTILATGSSSSLSFDLFQRGGDLTATAAAADYIRLFGNLDSSLGGTLFINNPTSLTGFAAGDAWRLFDLNSNSISNDFALNFSSLSLNSGLTGNFDRGTGTFSITAAIPEPSRALLLMLGLVGLVTRRRRSSSIVFTP